MGYRVDQVRSVASGAVWMGLPRPVQAADTPEKRRRFEVNLGKVNVRWWKKIVLPVAAIIVVWIIVRGGSGGRRDAGFEKGMHREEPVFTIGENGMMYPPRISPYDMNRYRRTNGVLVSLVRNEEVEDMKKSMTQVEYRFNRKFRYPWVFLNDKPFTEEFKDSIRRMTQADVTFAEIPEWMWSYPEFIDQERAAEARRRMAAEGIVYGGMESYRHMCRFNSGFFFRHPALQQYDWYWRVEPDIELHCDVEYDPFLFMEANNKTYGFTMALYEYEPTIPSLWKTTREFLNEYPHRLLPHNGQDFLLSNPEQGWASAYNLCHFWSNFEIADMRFWRSRAYEQYFEYLDRSGGFYYERWGDAPVHSLAVSFFLPRSRVHFFEDIGYSHMPWTHCPLDAASHETRRCSCNPRESFDYDAYSCLPAWLRLKRGRHG